MWPFRRKAKPQPPTPPRIDRSGSAEDWKIGDLARCIGEEWAKNGVNHPKTGDTLRVTSIKTGVGDLGAFSIYLGFEGKGPYWWEHIGFRKIRPIIAPAEDEFIVELHDKLKQPERV